MVIPILYCFKVLILKYMNDKKRRKICLTSICSIITICIINFEIHNSTLQFEQRYLVFFLIFNSNIEQHAVHYSVEFSLLLTICVHFIENHPKIVRVINLFSRLFCLIKFH